MKTRLARIGPACALLIAFAAVPATAQNDGVEAETEERRSDRDEGFDLNWLGLLGLAGLLGLRRAGHDDNARR